MARTTQEVFDHHLAAMGSGDLDEIAMDYADDAILVTFDGSFVGKAAVRAFFEGMLPALAGFIPTSSEVAVEGDTLVTAWSGESNVLIIRQGVDSFVIRDGLIERQTYWGLIEPKGG